MELVVDWKIDLCVRRSGAHNDFSKRTTTEYRSEFCHVIVKKILHAALDHKRVSKRERHDDHRTPHLHSEFPLIALISCYLCSPVRPWMKSNVVWKLFDSDHLLWDPSAEDIPVTRQELVSCFPRIAPVSEYSLQTPIPIDHVFLIAFRNEVHDLDDQSEIWLRDCASAGLVLLSPSRDVFFSSSRISVVWQSKEEKKGDVESFSNYSGIDESEEFVDELD